MCLVLDNEIILTLSWPRRVLSRYCEKCLTWQHKVTWFPCSHVSSESLPLLLSSFFTPKKTMHPCASSHLELQCYILARTAAPNVTLLKALQMSCSFYNNPSYYYRHHCHPHPHFTDMFIKTSGFQNVTQLGWIDGTVGKEFTLSSTPRTHRA